MYFEAEKETPLGTSLAILPGNHPSTAEGVGSISSVETKIPHVVWPNK